MILGRKKFHQGVSIGNRGGFGCNHHDHFLGAHIKVPSLGSERLLISGVNNRVSREELQKAMGESDAVMNCCVDLGRLARDTVGNAYEASLWASENKFNTLLIVTSAYHMPRSLVELKRQMPNKHLHAFSPRADAVHG